MKFKGSLPLNERTESAQAIQSFRAERRLTQKQLSELTGIPVATIGYLELKPKTKNDRINIKMVRAFQSVGLDLTKINSVIVTDGVKAVKLNEITSNFIPPVVEDVEEDTPYSLAKKHIRRALDYINNQIQKEEEIISYHGINLTKLRSQKESIVSDLMDEATKPVKQEQGEV